MRTPMTWNELKPTRRQHTRAVLARDGETEVELQRVSLPELCRITLERTRGTIEPFGFIFVRRGASFASCIARDRGFASTHLLGPGDYELWWQARGGDRARSLAFRIAPGQTELALAVPVDGVTASPRTWNELSR